MNREASWGAVGVDYQPHEEERKEYKKVAVLGHSYVRDLNLPARSNLGFTDKVAFYRKFYVPGATVASIQTGAVWERFITYKPELTFLLIGGNDITPQSSPSDIARAIIALAKRIKEEIGGEIRILTVERRPVPQGVSSIRYSHQRNFINRFLKHRDAFTKERLVFSKAKDQDSQDGVHLRLRALDDLAHNIVQHTEGYDGFA